MWKNNFLIYLILGSLVINTSCKSLKNERLEKVDKIGKITNIPDIKLRNLLRSNELDFDKIYLKKANINVSINNNKKSFKGSIVIKKDSAIVVSIFAPMGIELIRAKFDTDSIYIIDKYNKVVLTSDYSYFERFYGVDLSFSTLQAILTNSLFIYPVKNEFYEDLKKYKHTVTDSCFSFRSVSSRRIERKTKRNANNLIVHEINIYPDIFRIFNVYIKDFQNNETLIVDYKNFTNFENVLFPEKIKLNGIQGNSNINIKLKINSVEINEGGSLFFKIPDKFKQKNL